MKNKITGIFLVSIILLFLCSSCLPFDAPKETPDYVHALDVIKGYNHELVNYIQEQAWYKDGIDTEEAMFLDYGLRMVLTYQAAHDMPAENEELRHVVENKLYKIEPIQLKRGTVYILVISDIPDDIEPILRFLKTGAPIAESFLGITYPNNFITAFADSNSSDSYGGNETLMLGIKQMDTNLSDTQTTCIHELIHAMWFSGKTTYLNDTKEWISEGIAEFGAYYVLQQINISPPQWFVWDGSVEARYDYFWEYTQGNGIWFKPITKLDLSDPYNATVVGYLFLKDLHDLMGNESFSKMLGNLYIYKQPFRKVVIDEKKLESEALHITNSDLSIQNLFDTRI